MLRGHKSCFETYPTQLRGLGPREWPHLVSPDARHWQLRHSEDSSSGKHSWLDPQTRTNGMSPKLLGSCVLLGKQWIHPLESRQIDMPTIPG